MDAPQPPPPASLVAYALAVLTTPCAFAKAALTREALAAWRAGALPPFVDADAAADAAPPPERPARDSSLTLVSPGAAPKRGRGGTPASRLALLHSLAHIESWAIDLSWDIIARFALAERMERAFFDDWAEVAAEEASHFELLAARLEALGSRYGALPVHDGLWESATRTAGSLAARLAVEHCTHEARGLDVLPQTIGRFRAGGDEGTAALLEQRILPVRCARCCEGDVVPRACVPDACVAVCCAGGGFALRQGRALVPLPGAPRRRLRRRGERGGGVSRSRACELCRCAQAAIQHRRARRRGLRAGVVPAARCGCCRHC
jgi:uncharacterized ferritin-like protein (DUF455 family)